MMFDFDRFSEITAGVHPPQNLYSLEDALNVFRYYFQRYEEHTGHPHPPIKAAQIKRLCECMPFLDRTGGSIADIDPEAYPLMIEKHFETKYRNCDWNINHFFYGRIRAMRFYEVCY